MKLVFVDTSGWVACADGNDPAHGKFSVIRDRELRAGKVMVTTDYVADETLTLLRLRLGLAAARQWWETTSQSPRVRMVGVDAELFDQGLMWFFQYTDKGFSFTDCTSFAVMRRDKIREALATDHHFSQAGFVRLS